MQLYKKTYFLCLLLVFLHCVGAGSQAGMQASSEGAADVDECTNTPDICGTGGTCTDTDGSYTCTCADGYTGGGSATPCTGSSLQCYQCSNLDAGCLNSGDPPSQYLETCQADEVFCMAINGTYGGVDFILRRCSSFHGNVQDEECTTLASNYRTPHPMDLCLTSFSCSTDGCNSGMNFTVGETDIATGRASVLAWVAVQVAGAAVGELFLSLFSSLFGSASVLHIGMLSLGLPIAVGTLLACN